MSPNTKKADLETFQCEILTNTNSDPGQILAIQWKVNNNSVFWGK